jgi:hypothetical protein
MKKLNKGDLVRVNVYNAWSTEGPAQKSMFMKYDLLAIVLEKLPAPFYKLHLLSDDKLIILHEEDIKCIES